MPCRTFESGEMEQKQEAVQSNLGSQLQSAVCDFGATLALGKHDSHKDNLNGEPNNQDLFKGFEAAQCSILSTYTESDQS
jgi:hypothetical protein